MEGQWRGAERGRTSRTYQISLSRLWQSYGFIARVWLIAGLGIGFPGFFQCEWGRRMTGGMSDLTGEVMAGFSQF